MASDPECRPPVNLLVTLLVNLLDLPPVTLLNPLVTPWMDPRLPNTILTPVYHHLRPNFPQRILIEVAGFYFYKKLHVLVNSRDVVRFVLLERGSIPQQGDTLSDLNLVIRLSRSDNHLSSVTQHDHHHLHHCHLDDFLQHGLGDIDEEEGVCAVRSNADELVTVVVGRQQVHLGEGRDNCNENVNLDYF